MAIDHQPAELEVVGASERIGKPPYPLVLVDDMAGPTTDRVVVDRRHLIERGGAERADLGLRPGALGDPVGVGRAEQRAVGDEPHDDLDVVGNRHLFDGQLVAVDERGVTGGGCGDAVLVHDAGRHAGRRMLRTSRRLGQFERCPPESERPSDGAFQRCARRQTGAGRNARFEVATKARRSRRVLSPFRR